MQKAQMITRPTDILVGQSWQELDSIRLGHKSILVVRNGPHFDPALLEAGVRFWVTELASFEIVGGFTTTKIESHHPHCHITDALWEKYGIKAAMQKTQFINKILDYSLATFVDIVNYRDLEHTIPLRLFATTTPRKYVCIRPSQFDNLNPKFL